MLRSLPQLSLANSGLVTATSRAAVEQAWRRVRKWQPRFGGWGLYTALCFLIGLLVTFPSGVVVQRLVWSMTQHTPLQVRYESGDLSFPGIVVFQELEVKSATGARIVPLRFTELSLNPSLIGLLWGRPFPLAIDAALYAGTLSGVMEYEADTFGVEFSLRQLDLFRIPFPDPWGQGRLSGHMTIEGRLQGNGAQLNSLQGDVTLVVTDGKLQAGNINDIRLPALDGISVRGEVSVSKGQIQVHTLSVETDGAEAQLNGTITLRQPLEQSLLNLQLVATKTGSPPPALATLISLMPASKTTPGKRQVAITGAISAPVVR